MKILTFFLIYSFVSFVNTIPLISEDILKYLEKYGYTLSKKHHELSEKESEDAVKLYQKINKFKETGAVNEEMRSFMDKPRCNMPDVEYASSSKSRKWRKTHLTYRFVNYPINDLGRHTTRKEIEKAFEIWSQHTPLTFEYVRRGPADIDIHFYQESDGDGPGKTLAYAYYPEDGNVHFDAENWTPSGTKKGFNLYLVAAHEFGHSLGLPHSEFSKALMYPYIGENTPNFMLHRDDISRIQRLYGKKMNKYTVCLMGDIDAAVATSEDTFYLLKDDYVWKYEKKKLVEDYPKHASSEWRGLPNSVDTAFFNDEKFHFLKGNSFWVYKNSMDEESFTRPRNIKADASLSIENRFYLFTGSQYWRYDQKKNSKLLAENYPRSISSFWKGVPSDVQAAFYDYKRYAYFFKGDTVYKFDLYNQNQNAISQPIQDWLECSS